MLNVKTPVFILIIFCFCFYFVLMKWIDLQNFIYFLSGFNVLYYLEISNFLLMECCLKKNY